MAAIIIISIHVINGPKTKIGCTSVRLRALVLKDHKSLVLLEGISFNSLTVYTKLFIFKTGPKKGWNYPLSYIFNFIRMRFIRSQDNHCFWIIIISMTCTCVHISKQYND